MTALTEASLRSVTPRETNTYGALGDAPDIHQLAACERDAATGLLRPLTGALPFAGFSESTLLAKEGRLDNVGRVKLTTKGFVNRVPFGSITGATAGGEIGQTVGLTDDGDGYAIGGGRAIGVLDRFEDGHYRIAFEAETLRSL